MEHNSFINNIIYMKKIISYVCTYTLTPTSIKRGPEKIPEVTLTEFPGNSFILCYCRADITNTPPSPSN